MIDGTVVTAGSAVKALGGGRFAGYGGLYTSADDTDRQNEYFHRACDFDLADRHSVPAMYHHGLDPTFKGRKLARAIPHEDDAGVYFETRLVATDEPTERLIDAGNRGLLAFSSGSAAHLVQKKTMPNGARRIDVWPIVELSLCPQDWAVEPRAKVVALKTFAIDMVPFTQLMAQQDANVEAGRRAAEIHAQVLVRQHEMRMREIEQSLHSESKAEEHAYYN